MGVGLLFKIVTIIHLCLFTKCSGSTSVQGYYWRDFNGEIPDDAFPGGRDRNGKPIYIGQILHDDKLLTTKIYENDRKGYYGLGGREYSGTENHKILCSQFPDNFVWVLTKNDEIHLLTNHQIVLGGHEPGFTMYIGRVFYKLETMVGKVSRGKTDNHGLFITDSGNEINIKSFEILTYNSSYSIFSIDVRTNCK